MAGRSFYAGPARNWAVFYGLAGSFGFYLVTPVASAIGRCPGCHDTDDLCVPSVSWSGLSPKSGFCCRDTDNAGFLSVSRQAA